MNGPPDRDAGPEQLRRVDRLADAFEGEWRAGRRPAVEDFVARAAEADRPAVLRELLALDAEYRRDRGEDPTPGQAPTVAHAGPGADGPTPAAPRPTVPGYELLEELGRGGMGVVHKARDLRLDRVVALKTILAGADPGPDRLARFRAEARATARLRHPHIVQIQTVGAVDGLPYLELEFVDGGSLADRLAGGGRFAPAEAARLVERVARAVHHAHQNGVVHRDLKPANVLLTRDGEPKVTDFGLAKFTDAADGRTAAGDVLGTLPYLSPEQARGDARDVGPAADVHALGVILFELLTGRVPFAAAGPHALVLKVAGEEAPSPRAFAPDVPADLEAVCLECLEKDPARRYPSAEALAGDLAAFLAGARLPRARPRGPAGRAGELVVGVDPNCPPFAFREGGELTGLDVELARALAARLGREVRYVEYGWASWPEMLARLEAREVDALVSAVTVTEARKRQVALVEYARDPLVFTARPGSGIAGRGGLAGRVVAVQEGTTAQEAAERLRRAGNGFARVDLYPTTPGPFEAVRDGRADATLDHRLIARYAARDGSLEVLGPVGQVLDPEPLGVALRKDAAALRAAVEEAVGRMREDGELARLHERWAGEGGR